MLLVAFQGNSYDAGRDSLYRLYLIATIIGVVGGLIGLGIIWKQTKHTAIATEAANANAKAMINAERAWVMVDLQWSPVDLKVAYGSGQSGDTVDVTVLCLCWNAGKSIGWITEKWATLKVYDRIPEHPDFSDNQKVFQHSVQPIASEKSDDGVRVWLNAPGTHEDRLRRSFVIYGYVKYRTIFGKEGETRETRFGYVLTPQTNLDRMPAEYPEYNRNT